MFCIGGSKYIGGQDKPTDVTYLMYETQLSTVSKNFDVDDISKWRNPIHLGTNNASNMCSVTLKIIVDLIRVFRFVCRCSTTEVTSTALKESV